MGNYSQYNIKSCCCKDDKANEEYKDKWCDTCHLHIQDPNINYIINNTNDNNIKQEIKQICQCNHPIPVINSINNAYMNNNYYNNINEKDLKNANDYNVNKPSSLNKISEINKSVTAVFNKLENNTHSQKTVNKSNKDNNDNKIIKEIDNNKKKVKEEAKAEEKKAKKVNKNSINDNNNKDIETNPEQNFILNKLKQHNNQDNSDSSLSNTNKNSNNNNNPLQVNKKPSSNQNLASNNTSQNQKCLKNYTFSSENNSLLKCDYFIRSMIKNKDGSSKMVNNLQFLPKHFTGNQNDIILANEFYFNFYTINNRLQRTKTKEVSQTKRYVILTRISLKFSRNKNTFISFGTFFNEIKLHDITKIELIKNPFSKIHLYTINITYGKENFDISISSEDEKEVESWFKLINYLMKSNFL